MTDTRTNAGSTGANADLRIIFMRGRDPIRRRRYDEKESRIQNSYSARVKPQSLILARLLGYIGKNRLPIV